MEKWTPYVTIETDLGDVTLTWFNSILRTYKDAGLDHVEYLHSDGRIKGLSVGRAIMDTLFELEFPMRFDPVADQETIEWYCRLEQETLNDEIESL